MEKFFHLRDGVAHQAGAPGTLGASAVFQKLDPGVPCVDAINVLATGYEQVLGHAELEKKLGPGKEIDVSKVGGQVYHVALVRVDIGEVIGAANGLVGGHPVGDWDGIFALGNGVEYTPGGILIEIHEGSSFCSPLNITLSLTPPFFYDMDQRFYFDKAGNPGNTYSFGKDNL